MKNSIKGVLGLLFILSFFWQLFNAISSPPEISFGSDAEFAIRVGTSLAVSLVLGIWLLRSSFKKNKKNMSNQENV